MTTGLGKCDDYYYYAVFYNIYVKFSFPFNLHFVVQKTASKS